MGTRIITRRPSLPVCVAREARTVVLFLLIGIALGCVLFLSSLGTLWLLGVLAP